MRVEGADYIVKDGDVFHFRFNVWLELNYEWIIEITAKDNHQFSAYISQPSGKPKAGIVIIQEIFGVNTHIKEVTDLYASKGYFVLHLIVWQNWKKCNLKLWRKGI